MTQVLSVANQSRVSAVSDTQMANYFQVACIYFSTSGINMTIGYGFEVVINLIEIFIRTDLSV